MTKAKHTPTPLRAERTPGWGSVYCILADGPKPLFIAVKPDDYYTDFAPGSTEGSIILSDDIAAKQGRYVATPEIKAKLDAAEKANAQHIVRAVNAYDDMLAALRDIAAIDDDAYSVGAASRGLSDVGKIARAVLSRAEGSQP